MMCDLYSESNLTQLLVSPYCDQCGHGASLDTHAAPPPFPFLLPLHNVTVMFFFFDTLWDLREA